MATYYWVGGSGTWDNANNANWASSSGGAGGAGVPVAADNIIFDANSGTAATVTVAGTAAGNLVTINKSDITLSLSGSPTFNNTFTFTTGIISLNSHSLTALAFASGNANARTINFGTGRIIVTGNNTNAWSCLTTTNLVITGSRIVEANYSGSVGTRNLYHASAESNSVSFYITAGTDTVNVISNATDLNFTGFSGTFALGGRTLYGSLTLSAGMTINAGASITTFGATSGTQQITTNGKTLDFPLTFNGIGGTFAFQDALTQGSTRAFTITNGTVKLKNGVTSTVGAFATSGTNQKFLQSTVTGSQATLSQANGTVSASYLTIQDINATGGATWNSYTTNNNVDAGNNAGWDFNALQLGRYIYTRRKNKRILS